MPRLGSPGPILICALLLISTISGAQHPTEITRHLTVLHCDEPASVLPAERVVKALRYAADEMGITESELPRIVVIRCTPASADVALVPIGKGGGITVDTVAKGRVYDLWVVGDDVDAVIVRGLVSILAIERGFNVSEQEEHVRKVYDRLTASVSAHALRRQRN